MTNEIEIPSSDSGARRGEVEDPAAAPAPETLSQRLGCLLRGRWRWAISLSVVLGTGLGVLGWWIGQKTYISRAQVFVAPYSENFGFSPADASDAETYDSFVETQMEFIKTNRVLDNAMDSESWRALGRGISDKKAKDFRENLAVSNKGEIITIEMKDTDPNAAMVGVKAVVEAYKKLNDEQESQRGQEKLDFLQSERFASDARLRDIDGRIDQKFGVGSGFEQFSVDDLPALFALRLSELGTAEGRLQEIRHELIALEAPKQVGVTTRPAPGTGPLDNASPAAMSSRQRPATAPAMAAPGTLARAKAPATVPAMAAPAPLAARPMPARPQPAPRQPVAVAPAGGQTAPESPQTTRPSPEQIALDSPQMNMLVQQKRELESQLRRMVAHYGPNHPLVSIAQNDLNASEAAIQEFADRYLAWKNQPDSRDEVALKRLEILEQTLEESFRIANSRLDAVSRLKASIQPLREQEQLEKQNRDDLQKRIENQERLTKIKTGRLRVLEPGEKPFEAANDTRPRNAALCGLGGVALAFGLVLMAGLSDRRVRGPDDARRLGLGQRPVLGLLPEVSDELTDPALAAQAAHCVHQIRTLLQLWYGWMSRPVLAITGPSAGTGKTTLTLALGVSYAEARTKTLLIDFDFVAGGLTEKVQAIKRRRIGELLRREGVLRPEQLEEGLELARTHGYRLGETLVKLGHVQDSDISAALVRQQEITLGVLDVLESEQLCDCVCETQIPYLSILPVGSAGSHHIGKLSPLAIQRLVDAARAAYDVVLIDTGPIPGSLEGYGVVAAADGVILTVSKGDMRAGMQKCVDYIESVGARLAGVVFNRATARDLQLAGSSGSISQPDRSTGQRSDLSKPGGFGPFGRAVALAAKRESAGQS